ncbi:MAG: SDR family oxidoreductase [Gammaproteobacteria bacterium]|nr:SDR family oxidoreductase [Gammaproteobacteria bacterium]
MPLTDYRTAVVTGASSGIGAATVQALTRRGLQVHAIARRKERLATLAAETGCTTHALDLCDTDELYRLLGGIETDVLVNNAGMGRGFDTIISATREDIQRSIDTNVTAALHVVRAVVAGMVERRRGHMVHLGSIAGLYPLLSSIYGASKGAIHLMSQNLRMELKGSGVRNTEICPGRVHTEFFDTAIDDEGRRESMVRGFELMQSQDIADAIVFALDMPWRVNISTIEMTPTEQAPGGLVIEPVARD